MEEAMGLSAHTKLKLLPVGPRNPPLPAQTVPERLWVTPLLTRPYCEMGEVRSDPRAGQLKEGTQHVTELETVKQHSHGISE